MPIADWQFWLVTAGALAALWFIVRPLLPRRRPRKVRGRQTALTVKGRDARS